jgi:predicted AAA+ superfamily ATPase
MSFLEFLYAQGEHRLVEEIQNHDLREEMIAPIHDKLLSLVAEYMCIGGMPEVVQCWVKKKDVKECSRIQNEIIDSYTQDFVKYASKFQIKYVDFLFQRIPLQLGKKFKFSLVDGEYRKRELAPCLHLLNLAGVTRQVFQTSGNGLPLGAEANPDKFKVVFVDVALAQVILGLDLSTWLWDSMQSLVNKGQIVEAFIGQEMLAYSDPEKKAQLYYWHKEARSSQAEVDYLLQKNEHIIPIEVKSGDRGNLKSLRMFLESHQNSPFGIRFSTHNYSKYDNIHSYPLYAVFTLLKEKIFK